MINFIKANHKELKALFNAEPTKSYIYTTM